MTVEFDPVKAGANLLKHGVSLADAAGVLDDTLAVTVEDRNSVGEPRFVTIGMSSISEILVVVDDGGEHRQQQLPHGKTP